MNKIVSLIVAALSLVSTAHADGGPYGVWRRPEDGSTYILYRCGRDGLCAKLKSVKDRPESGLIGSTVFSSSGRAGPQSWMGEIRNPLDGRTFSSKITQIGDTTLLLDGCLPTNEFCTTEKWRRAY